MQEIQGYAIPKYSPEQRNSFGRSIFTRAEGVNWPVTTCANRWFRCTTGELPVCRSSVISKRKRSFRIQRNFNSLWYSLYLELVIILRQINKHCELMRLQRSITRLDFRNNLACRFLCIYKTFADANIAEKYTILLVMFDRWMNILPRFHFSNHLQKYKIARTSVII